MTVEGLLDRFALCGGRDALVVGDETISYRALLDAIDARDLRDIPLGSVVALVGDFDLPTVATLFALWRRDCTVVPMMSLDLRRCAIAEAEFIVSADCVQQTGAQKMHPLYFRLQGPGLALFTSGSTGTPKAVLHQVDRWMERLARPGHRHRTLAFLSFDHVGGLNTLLYALANGGCVVVPEDRSPSSVWRAMAAHGVELLPTTPTFLRLALLDGPFPRLPDLRMVAYGSEPMASDTLSAIQGALPGVALKQQFGMSELGVVRSQSLADGSIWVRLENARVVDGLLEVRTETAMVGYLNAPSPFTPDGWLRTGDEAETDGEYIRILGRRSETINVGGEKVHPAEVEAGLEALRGVTHAIVRGEANVLTGQVVVAAVRLSTSETIEAFRARMRAELKGKLPRYALPQRVERLECAVGGRGKKARTFGEEVGQVA